VEHRPPHPYGVRHGGEGDAVVGVMVGHRGVPIFRVGGEIKEYHTPPEVLPPFSDGVGRGKAGNLLGEEDACAATGVLEEGVGLRGVLENRVGADDLRAHPDSLDTKIPDHHLCFSEKQFPLFVAADSEHYHPIKPIGVGVWGIHRTSHGYGLADMTVRYPPKNLLNVGHQSCPVRHDRSPSLLSSSRSEAGVPAETLQRDAEESAGDVEVGRLGCAVNPRGARGFVGHWGEVGGVDGDDLAGRGIHDFFDLGREIVHPIQIRAFLCPLQREDQVRSFFSDRPVRDRTGVFQKELCPNRCVGVVPAQMGTTSVGRGETVDIPSPNDGRTRSVHHRDEDFPRSGDIDDFQTFLFSEEGGDVRDCPLLLPRRFGEAKQGCE